MAWRWDPFNQTYIPRAIVSEEHKVTLVPELGSYGIRINEHPQRASPSTVSIRRKGDGKLFNEVPTELAPGINEFRVDYTYFTGLIETSGLNNNQTLRVTYKGLGEIGYKESLSQMVLGTFFWHMLHLTGAKTLIELRELGFAIMNGTTGQAQGIVNPVITTALPNLIAPAGDSYGRFLRASLNSGIAQGEAMYKHKHNTSESNHTHGYLRLGFVSKNALGSGTIADFPLNTIPLEHFISAAGGLVDIAGDAANLGGHPAVSLGEIRPACMTAVPMMKVK